MAIDEKWMGTTCLRSKPEKVDAKTGVIRGVKVCTEGEAKGHGVHLDNDFIDTVVAQGSAYSRGLKARFGHPNMCNESLGTYLGRFQNFQRGETVREDGTSAACCFADLHLSDTAKETPSGDLFAYLLSMAEDEADMFGASIVFHVGKTYRRDKKTGEKAYRRIHESFREISVWYVKEDGERLSKDEEKDLTDELFVECKKLVACDCVDDPAVNDGLFSAFSGGTVAGQITQFLDLHPHVFEILEQSPEIVEAVAKYGRRFDQFLTRYREYRATTTPTQERSMDLQALKKEYPELVVALSAEIVAGLKQEDLATGNPALVSAITGEAVKLGAQQERDRIAAVRAQTIPGHEDLIAKMEMDGTSTGADAALAIVAAEKTARQKQAAEFLAGGNPPVSPSGDGDGHQAKATMKRAAFNALSPVDRGEVIKSGVKIVD